MIREEDDCVGCKSIGLPCLGRNCPNRHRIHMYCDKCGKQDELYWYEDEQICIDCIGKIEDEIEKDIELIKVEID